MAGFDGWGLLELAGLAGLAELSDVDAGNFGSVLFYFIWVLINIVRNLRVALMDHFSSLLSIQSMSILLSSQICYRLTLREFFFSPRGLDPNRPS